LLVTSYGKILGFNFKNGNYKRGGFRLKFLMFGLSAANALFLWLLLLFWLLLGHVGHLHLILSGAIIAAVPQNLSVGTIVLP